MIIFNLAANLEEDNEVRDSYQNRNVIKLINADDTMTFNNAVLNCLHYQNKIGSMRQVLAVYIRLWQESIALCSV